MRAECDKFKGTESEGYKQAYQAVQHAIAYCDTYSPQIREAKNKLVWVIDRLVVVAKAITDLGDLITDETTKMNAVTVVIPNNSTAISLEKLYDTLKDDADDDKEDLDKKKKEVSDKETEIANLRAALETAKTNLIHAQITLGELKEECIQWGIIEDDYYITYEDHRYWEGE